MSDETARHTIFRKNDWWSFTVLIKLDSLETIKKIASIDPRDISQEMLNELEAVFNYTHIPLSDYSILYPGAIFGLTRGNYPPTERA